MPKVSPLQANYNTGEISPLMYGRVDIDKYRNALRTCLNSIPAVQGAILRRPGSVFVAEVKDSSKATRLVRFEFSTTQAYIIEFGDLYCRFYRDHGQIISGTPVEIVTPYTAAQLFELKFAQSADVLYIAHPSHAPRKLSRTSHTAWSLDTITFNDGPYLPTNTTATTFTPAATSGTNVVITASSTTGINGGAGFRASDVGRTMRIKHGTTWGIARIVTFTDTTHVEVNTSGAFGATTASTSWRLSVWNSTDGYPSCVTFFEDRLGWAGAPQTPSRIDLSMTGAYETFSPSEADGTVADDHGVSYTLNSNDVQVIRWMLDDEKGLLVGTVKGEWIVRPSSQSEALTPTNVSAKQSTSHGSANTQAIRAAKAALYVQRAGRKLRELAYVYESDGFRSPDMTVLAEHITKGGIKEIAYQQEPLSIVWAARNDGVLLGFTYEREQNVLGWHRHVFGGTAAKVESVATIPEPNGAYEEAWMIVNRTIGGATKRYVEYMSKVWERGDVQEDAVYVDSALTYDGVAATTISGLSHLNGETVTILADGAAHSSKVVAAGQITLDYEASVVQVGLGYNSDGELLRMDVGAADGTSMGKTQRIHRIAFYLHDSLGLQFGPSLTDLTRITFREADDDTGEAVPLFSGVKNELWPGGYTDDAHVCWRWDQPLPGTILAIMPQMHTQDR